MDDNLGSNEKGLAWLGDDVAAVNKSPTFVESLIGFVDTHSLGSFLVKYGVRRRGVLDRRRKVVLQTMQKEVDEKDGLP